MKIISFLFCLLIIACSGERKFKKGSNLFLENTDVVRVDCTDELCIDKKESRFTEQEINSLLLQRISFEIDTLERLIAENPHNDNLILKRKTLLTYKESDLFKMVKSELTEERDIEFRSYIYAATDKLEN